jgi:signal transduction histidine kinase
MMLELWKSISNVGLRPGLKSFDERSLIFVNRITAVIAVFLLTSIFINLAIGSYFFIRPLTIGFLLLLSAYYMNHLGKRLLAGVTICIVILGLLEYMCIQAGPGAGLEFYFLSLAMLPMIIFRRHLVIYIFQGLCMAGIIGQKFFSLHQNVGAGVEYKVFFVVNGFYSMLLIVLAISFFRNISLKHEKKLITNNATIEKRNSQLQTLNDQLDSFTYSVSHDLRAPLRAIEGFSNVLKTKITPVLMMKAGNCLTLCFKIRNK